MTMAMDHVIEAAVMTIRQHAEQLTVLDQAIGDGDHGINMKRGFDAIAAADDELRAMSPDRALQKMGMTLIMTVGGASGPLYGSLLMAMGKVLSDPAAPTDLAHALVEGVAAVKKRGRSDVGDKTMLDVLVPVSLALEAGARQGIATQELLRQVAVTAETGLTATQSMQAQKGRASFLGERSIGHLDPGAMSSCLLVKAVCECLQRKQDESNKG